MSTLGAASPSGESINILVVCTANVCRSPVAERLFQRELDGRGVRAHVMSAGTHGGRNTVHADTMRAARLVNVDLADHRSRLLTPELIEHDGRDLVITMTRSHLRDVVGAVPGAWERTFTLKELARRVFDIGAGVDDMDSWVRAGSAGRRASDLMSASIDDDTSDPYGGPYRGHVDMAHEVAELTKRIVRVMPLADGSGRTN